MKTKAKSKPKSSQYTIRGIPDDLDRALRQNAVREGKSLNQFLIEILEQGLRPHEQPKKHRDLSFLIGTWVEDPAFDAVIADHDKIDEEMWR